jgi:hypothetical protein
LRIGALFLAACGLLLALGASAPHWIINAICLYAAASAAFVGGAYLANRPGLFHKSPRGVVPVARLPHLWPYFALKRLELWRIVRFDRENPWDEILPGLLLGRCLVFDRERPRVSGVLDLTAEYTEVANLRRGVEYLCLPVLDNQAPSPSQLAEAVRFIGHHRDRGGVFVHCAAGHGRSAMVVAAYLMAIGEASRTSEAIRLLRGRRPCVHLTKHQKQVLRGG